MNKSIPFRTWALPTVVASVLLSSACSDGSSSDSSMNNDDVGVTIETAGRLALYGSDGSAVRMLDLDTETMLQSFALTGGDARLYSSPDKRYAVVIQRDDNKVSFIDGGLYTEDHVDHLHDYREDPIMLDYGLSGIRPTHYSAHEDHAVIFFDADEGVPSAVTVLSDAGIGTSAVTGELTLTNSMHGAAKFINDKLFVTYRDPFITETVLPAAIERYSMSDGVAELEERYDEPCPRLHGNASNESWLAFGCADGVLAVDIKQETYPVTKLDNPASMAEEGRVGTLYAHPALEEMVGVARGQAFVVSPGGDEAFRELPFPEGNSMVSQGFNVDGETYYILGGDGMLYLYDVVADWEAVTPVVVATSIGEEDTAPVVVASSVDDRLYVLNTNGQQVIEVDSVDGSIVRTIDLDFSATRMTWLGIPE